MIMMEIENDDFIRIEIINILKYYVDIHKIKNILNDLKFRL